jgi:TATA-box binding protein (TBP) (component of TFIID and TFIIIB)
MFDVSNIAYYFNDFDDIVIGKKYGNRVVNNLINIKKVKTGKKKKRKEKKNFFNQVSLIFRSATLMGIDPDRLSLKEKFKNINVKLFINGSIQMTGCKHLDNIKKCLEILFEKLKVTKAVLNKNMEFEKKTFVKSLDNLDLSKIKLKLNKQKLKERLKAKIIIKKPVFNKNNKIKNTMMTTNGIYNHVNVDDDELNDGNEDVLTDNEIDDEQIDEIDNKMDNETDDEIDDMEIILDMLKGDAKKNCPTKENFNINFLDIKNIYLFDIRMINTNFNIGFQINRERLFQLLRDRNYDVTFNPIIHACVNVKYTIPELNKTVSIFVFESGSITIAGSNSCEQILYTYNFINKLILSNYIKLLSKPITPQLIVQLIQNMK